MDSLRQGVTQDLSEATKWYRLAADQGEALAAVGSMYENGRGVPHNNEEAVRWYRAAATYPQSNAYAQFKIGMAYDAGLFGMPKNYREAVKWYCLAAHQGHSDAQVNLGYMYERGLGVMENVREAIKWYRRAAAQGNDRAQRLLDRKQKFNSAEKVAARRKTSWRRILAAFCSRGDRPRPGVRRGAMAG
jgi:TPR repeat protein